MIEELFELKQSMNNKETREVVKEKYRIYDEAYQNADKDIHDKIRYRDVTQRYWNYMYFSGRKE